MPYEMDLVTVSYTYNQYSGLKEGVFGEWYANGIKAKVGTYKGGKLVSSYKEWHDDGMPKLTCTYRDVPEEGDDGSEFRGQYTEWHSTGVLKADRLYNNAGKLIDYSATYHCNGERESLEYYNNGVKTGNYKEWYSNGKVRKSYAYDSDGNIHGEFDEFNEGGKKMCSGKYEHGKKIGMWYVYTGYGRVESKEEYKSGILISKYIFFGGRQNDYLQFKYDDSGAFQYKKRVFPCTYILREGVYHISYSEHDNRGVFNAEDGHKYYEGEYEEPLTSPEQ